MCFVFVSAGEWFFFEERTAFGFTLHDDSAPIGVFLDGGCGVDDRGRGGKFTLRLQIRFMLQKKTRTIPLLYPVIQRDRLNIHATSLTMLPYCICFLGSLPLPVQTADIICTETNKKDCTWLREFSPCSCLTTMPCSAWVLLSTTYKPFSPLQADRIKGLPDIITPDNLTNPLNMSYWQPKRIFLYWKSWLSIWMAHLAIPAVSYFWESLYSAARL